MRSQTVVLISVRHLPSSASFSCWSDSSICGDLSAEKADQHKPGCSDSIKELTRQVLRAVQNDHFEHLGSRLG